MQDLGTLGGSDSKGYAINASGQVTGGSLIVGSDPVYHAFLWNGTSMQDLGTLGGDTSSGADINDSGQVTGGSLIAGSDTVYHAFLWNGTSMQDLGTLGGDFSSGWGINNSGQVVGQSLTSAHGTSGFLWENGTMYDLNALMASPSPWWIDFAADINDFGQIAASGCSPTGAECHALRLDPVPEPTTVALLGGGLLGLAVARRRRRPSSSRS